LAAGLHPDPLGELKRSPDLIVAIWGILLRGGKEGSSEREEKRSGGEGEEGKGREGKGKERERYSPLLWILDTPLPPIANFNALYGN